ncbi:hypothetical protein cypCar_00047531, partial [Cyprinus carpio]
MPSVSSAVKDLYLSSSLSDLNKKAEIKPDKTSTRQYEEVEVRKQLEEKERKEEKSRREERIEKDGRASPEKKDNKK